MSELTEEQKRELDAMTIEHRIRIESRVKLLEVSPDFIFDLLNGSHNHYRRLVDLPDDLILIPRSASYLPLRNLFVLLVGSMEFESVPIGEQLPKLTITFERCDCTAQAAAS